MNSITNEQLINTLTPSQIEFVYRHQQNKYLKEDAAGHLAEHLMHEDEKLSKSKNIDEEEIAVALLESLSSYLEEMVELFLKYSSADVSSTCVWDAVMRHLSPESNHDVCLALYPIHKEIEDEVRLQEERGSSLEITGVTLLSADEATRLSEDTLKLGEKWWLSSPGDHILAAACVHSNGYVYLAGGHVAEKRGVRPALQISDKTPVDCGEKIRIAGETWTAVSDNLVLCDKIIAQHSFRQVYKSAYKNANVYAASDVKKWLDAWAREKGIMTAKTPVVVDYALQDIVDVTLLSKEEAMQVGNTDILSAEDNWWLRTPGEGYCHAPCVDKAGHVINSGAYSNADFGVRPALVVNDLSLLNLGDKITAAGQVWTVISADLVLCDRIVGECTFRDDYTAFDANVYATSDVRKWLNVWARKKGLTTRDVEPAATEGEGNPFDIADVTLLSAEEASQVSKDVLCANYYWWLRSPGSFDNSAACVYGDGFVDYYGYYVDGKYGVRPALRINNLKSANLGDKIRVAGEMWTVISDDMALCDRIIGRAKFRIDFEAADANKYEASDIKQWLNSWAKGMNLIK